MKRAMAAAALWAGIFATPATAQTQLFSDSAPLQITITAPISTLVQRAPHSTDPFPGAVTVGGTRDLPIQIAARGITRRMGGICSFPPIRLDFEEHSTAGTVFAGQNKLKLVDPCRNGASYEQLVVLEYLAYRLYNVITPVSYRVRAVRVTFRDSDHRRGDDTHFGYLIEEASDVAHRNHLHTLDLPSGAISTTQLDGAAAARFALFEYMISNLDWDMLQGPAGDACCHNSKLMAASAQSPADVAPAPYDFDYSGLVDAPYAIAPPGIRVSSVRTRYFRGYCRYNDQLAGVIAEYRAHRDELFAVIDHEPALDNGHRRAAHAYLQEFFDTLDNPDLVRRNLTGHCRGG